MARNFPWLMVVWSAAASTQGESAVSEGALGVFLLFLLGEVETVFKFVGANFELELEVSTLSILEDFGNICRQFRRR